MPKKCKKIKRKFSRYEICDNPGGRVNKLYVKSSEFPRERWLAKNMTEAKKTIELTEKILERRKKRGRTR